MSISIYEGSILDTETDVIVNAANGFLRHGAGLARAIDTAARGLSAAGTPWEDLPDFDEESERRRRVGRWNEDHKRMPTIAVGDAAATSPGLLPFKAVVHAVGPVWSGGHLYERDLLHAAHRNALRVAEEQGAKSIAFPAISCGLFRFPVEEAAPIAVNAAWTHADPEMDVVFALLDPEHIKAYRAALARIPARAQEVT